METTTSPQPQRRRAVRAPGQRPDQIMDAAARVLLRDGPAATIEDIATEAQLGKGTVYEYFASKAQLFTALRRRYTEQAIAAGRHAMPPPDATAIDLIRGFVGGMFRFAVTNADLVRLLFHTTGIDEPDELAAVAGSLQELVRAGVAAGELSVTDPEFTVEFLLHGLHGVLETSLARPEAPDRVLARLDPVLSALLQPRRSP